MDRTEHISVQNSWENTPLSVFLQNLLSFIDISEVHI